LIAVTLQRQSCAAKRSQQLYRLGAYRDKAHCPAKGLSRRHSASGLERSNMIKKPKQISRRSLKVGLISIGILNAFILSYVFEPLVHFVMYQDMIALGLFTSLLLLVFFLSVAGYWTSRNVQSSRRMFRLLLLGSSLTSFILAGLNFLTYPNALFSSGSSWITYGKDTVLFGGVRTSQIVLFLAKTLWSILTGSFFALLDRITDFFLKA
jgi:hypothetical protein